MSSVFQQNSRPLLSLCMIVKNEAHNLPRCLASAAPHVDEMIVVDTGSTDGTVAIAEDLGAKVSYFEWCDDFAAARNAALAQATGEWILTLDADEELAVDGIDLRQRLEASANVLEYSLYIRAFDDQGQMSKGVLKRLFRNLPGVQYVGRFHEQLCYPDLPSKAWQSLVLEGVTVIHYGYTQELWMHKLLNRNIPMLESAYQRGELNLSLLATLANMYEQVEKQDEAQQVYGEIFEKLLPHFLSGECPAETGFLRLLLYRLAYQALEVEDYETARMILKNGLAWFPDYPYLTYLTGWLLLSLNFPRGATGYFEYCLQMYRHHSYTKLEIFETSYMTSHPAYGLGYSWIKLQQWQKAAEAFQLCLSFDPEYAPARQQLAQIAQWL